jgi:hypothetical protein
MNAEQKRIYTQRITAVQLQASTTCRSTRAIRLEVAHDQSWKADKINTINLAAATRRLAYVATSVGEIKRLNAYQGARKGWDAEVLQAENGKDITNLHAQAIQTLAKDSPALAEAYFKAHELEIDGSKRAEIGEFAQKATAARSARTRPKRCGTSNGPKTDNDAANVDKMAKNDPREAEERSLYARRRAEQIARDRRRRATRRSRRAMRSAPPQVNTLLMGGASLAAVQQTPAWAALDGTEQKKIIEHEEAIAAPARAVRSRAICAASTSSTSRASTSP